VDSELPEEIRVRQEFRGSVSIQPLTGGQPRHGAGNFYIEQVWNDPFFVLRRISATTDASGTIIETRE